MLHILRDFLLLVRVSRLVQILISLKWDLRDFFSANLAGNTIVLLGLVLLYASYRVPVISAWIDLKKLALLFLVRDTMQSRVKAFPFKGSPLTLCRFCTFLNLAQPASRAKFKNVLQVVYIQNIFFVIMLKP